MDEIFSFSKASQFERNGCKYSLGNSRELMSDDCNVTLPRVCRWYVCVAHYDDISFLLEKKNKTNNIIKVERDIKDVNVTSITSVPHKMCIRQAY